MSTDTIEQCLIKKTITDLRARAYTKRVSKLTAELIADAQLVEIASNAMSRKLEAARKKGRHGWWDGAQCSITDLRAMLAEHVAKGDMRDVMVIAAMIYVREVVE